MQVLWLMDVDEEVVVVVWTPAFGCIYCGTRTPRWRWLVSLGRRCCCDEVWNLMRLRVQFLALESAWKMKYIAMITTAKDARSVMKGALNRP
jgi:hypothetical protein